MTPYSLILFAHVVAVLVLFAALSFEVLSLFHLRRASSMDEARLWIDAVPRLPVFMVGSLLVVFFSGIYLAVRIEAVGLAWPKVAVMALLLIFPLGVVTGRRMRAMRHICATTKASQSELLGRLQDPYLKISLGIRIAVLLGIVLLMTAKPKLWESLILVGSFGVLGWAAAALVSPGARAASAPDLDPRN